MGDREQYTHVVGACCSNSKSVVIATVIMIVAAHPIYGDSTRDPFVHTAAAAYCAISHPTEWFSHVRQSTCEQQHVIPQSCSNSGGRQRDEEGINDRNIVWWPASLHVRTDVWKDRAWCSARPWFDFAFTVDDAAEDLESAYMLGTFGLPWSLFLHSYNDQGGDHAGSRFIPTRFDAASNLVYAWGWLVNTPQKILNQVAYIVHMGHWHTLLDLVLFAFLLFPIELVLALASTVLGVVLGLALNPLDTVVALPSAIALLFETTFSALWYYVLGIWRTITAHWLYGIPMTFVGIAISLGGPLVSFRIVDVLSGTR